MTLKKWSSILKKRKSRKWKSIFRNSKAGKRKNNIATELRQIEVVSPAKLNLFFEIISQRKDGYHDIETVMQTVSICDRITLFEIENGFELTSNADWLPEGRDNLAVRAAELYCSQCSVTSGIRIHIEKNIPAGAGLGGGSSNAAAVLSGLNSLYGKLDKSGILKAAVSIGSDVPFFLDGGTALCRGKGELIESIESPGTFRYVIVKPGIEISTREAYDRFRLNNMYPDPPLNPKKVIEVIRSGAAAELDSVIFNRLQSTVLDFSRELDIFRQRLDSIGGSTYHLTGSGSAFFRPVATEREGLHEAETLKSHSELQDASVFYCEQF